jgi:hypothetical protein
MFEDAHYWVVTRIVLQVAARQQHRKHMTAGGPWKLCRLYI